MTSTLLRGGRVIDPGDGSDAVRDLLITDGRVAAVGPDLPAPDDATLLDVSGLIVGPGFVDLHSHVNSIAGQRLQAFDGVTTALELEVGLFPLAKAYDRAANDGRPLNYGFSASWSGARALAHLGLDLDANIGRQLAVLGDPGWQRSSTPTELDRWLATLAEELQAGALGVGVILGYAPRTDPEEYLRVAALAAAANAPVYTHVRELIEADPDTPIDGSEEVLRAAGETGAHMHHCHVNSTSRRHIDRVLAAVQRTQAAGAQVTIECYPYGAGSTGIGAFFLDPDRLSAWDLKPSDIVLVPTGERLADEARLREVRATAPQTACIVEFFDETDAGDQRILQRPFLYPDAIVASDAMPIFFADGAYESRDWPLPSGSTHPRTAGTYGRSVRQLVRERGAWTWLDAFRRCSHLPARVVASVAPCARDIGHLAPGAWADLVVLDPETFSDTATYLAPTEPSVGVRHLFVSGTPVIAAGQLLPDAYPGRPIRA